MTEDHRAHIDAWLDFWCSQLDRKVRYHDRKAEREKQGENARDEEEGDLYA